MDMLMENCSDGLVEQRALVQAQAVYYGLDLTEYKDKIRKEMEEKKLKRNCLKLTRNPPTATPKENDEINSSKYKPFEQKEDDDSSPLRCKFTLY